MKGKSNGNKKVFKLLENNANIIVILLLALLVLFPFIATRKALFGFAFDQESSWIGDAIGGITSPIIGLLSIFLIYLTYTSQKKEFKKLSKSSAIQNFESGFFYLLKNLENSIPLEISSFHNQYNHDFKYVFKAEFGIISAPPQYAQDTVIYDKHNIDTKSQNIFIESEVVKVRQPSLML